MVGKVKPTPKIHTARIKQIRTLPVFARGARLWIRDAEAAQDCRRTRIGARQLEEAAGAGGFWLYAQHPVGAESD